MEELLISLEYQFVQRINERIIFLKEISEIENIYVSFSETFPKDKVVSITTNVKWKHGVDTDQFTFDIASLDDLAMILKSIVL